MLKSILEKKTLYKTQTSSLENAIAKLKLKLDYAKSRD